MYICGASCLYGKTTWILPTPDRLIVFLAIAVFVLLLIRRQLGARGLFESRPFGNAVLSYRLGWVLLVYGVLGSLITLMISGDIDATSLGFVNRYLHDPSSWDSWYPIAVAIEHIRSDPDQLIYSSLFFAEGTVKFQYPLSALLPFDVIQRRDWFGGRWDQLFLHVDLLCWLSLPVLALVSFRFLQGEPEISATQTERPVWLDRIARLGLLALSTGIAISFFPLSNSYVLGQIQTPMSLAVALGMLCYQRNRCGLAGFWFGLCCAVKPQWAIIAVWALLRRQYRFATVLLTVFSVLVVLSIRRYGMSNVADYFPVLSFLSQHGEAFYANQSFNGLANRLLGNGGDLNLRWFVGIPDKSFPPFNKIVYGVTLFTSMLLLGLAMFWRSRQRRPVVDLAIVVLSLTIASPIAWVHHYGILLPIFALLWREMLFDRRRKWWPFVMLAFAYLLSSQMLEQFTNRFAYTSFNWLQSSLLFGALIVLGLLYRQTFSTMQETHPIEALESR